MKKSLILPLLFFLLTCSPNKPQINHELYGTWLVVGVKETEKGYTRAERGYAVGQSYLTYKVTENSIVEYTRGADYGISLPGGTIEYYDSIQKHVYGAQITGSTITAGSAGTLTYSLLDECGASFLKLSSTYTGYDASYGSVTVTDADYCVKVLIDSLPSMWPGDSDITVPDSGCTPSRIFTW
jgi:hypothetical protein